MGDAVREGMRFGCAELRADDSPPTLVWVEGKDGALWTHQVEPDGTSSARLEGAHVGTRYGTWTWVTQTIDVETEACDLPVGDVHPAVGGTVTRGSLVGAGGQEQLVVDPSARCDEHCPNELRHEARPIGSVGPYLFVEQSRYVYACGAHGSSSVSFVVWDMEGGRPVDLLGAVPNLAQLRDEATKRFRDDEESVGPAFAGSPPRITELVPLVDGRKLGFEAQLTIETCYACSDGAWSSYTRSVRLPTAPPAVLVPFARLPSSVATFLSRHPDLKLGGWSETRTPAIPQSG